MVAVGYTSGDPNKVDITGDTMTGDLILSGAGTDLTVGGVLTDGFQGVSGDLSQLTSSTLETGITSGGLLSINVSGTTIDVSAATGWILDYNSQGTYSATNPKLTAINFPGATNVVLTGPLTQLTTYWLINSAGTLIQQAARPSRTQYRTHLVVGASIQFGGTIFTTQSLAMMQSQTGPQLLDFMNSLGPFVVGAGTGFVTPNGVNKMINVSGGTVFNPEFGLPNYQDPHTGTLATQTPANFHYSTAVAGLAPLVNLIDVANYDPGGAGVVTPLGGGVNTSSIHRVFGISQPNVNDQILIQYGQTAYSNLANAVAGIGAGTFIINPNFTNIPLLGWIAATRVAVNLSDPTQATFVRASRFAFP